MSAALLSVFLCVQQTLAGLCFFVTLIQVSLSPGSTKMVPELGEGFGISDSIYHRAAEQCLLRLLVKARAYDYLGGMQAFFTFHCLH